MNPFKYGCVVKGENFCPRPELAKQLRAFAEAGQNVVIQGERRIGKTSLVKNVIGGMRGWRMVFIDLYCIHTISDFCRRVMNGVAAANDHLPFLKKAMALVHNLRPTLSFDPENGAPVISVDKRAAAEPDSITAVMRMLEKLGKDGKVCIVFDEFQDVLNLNHSDTIIAEMRSTIQFQQDTPYFFLGSVRNEMMSIFDSSDSPFYKSALAFEVGRIESTVFSKFIASRFKVGKRKVDSSTIEAIMKYCDGVPGDVQELCEALWGITDAGDTIDETLVPEALKLIYSREIGGFESVVRRMTRCK